MKKKQGSYRRQDLQASSLTPPCDSIKDLEMGRLSCAGSNLRERFLIGEQQEGDNPGGPEVGVLCFYCRGHGFNPWLRN